MAHKEENLFIETIGTIKHLWRHRKGNETVAAILDTFDNLGYVTKDQRKPALVARKQTAYGWHLIFKLPPGISYKSVLEKRHYFQDSCNAWVTIEWDGRVRMDIQSGKLPDSVPFEWDHRDYKKMCLPVPVGMTQKGIEVFDLADSPHLLVAGVPGFGKSNFLHVLIHSILPFANVAIIDLKRLEFAYLKDNCLVTRTQEDALELLKKLDKEMERRIDTLESAGVVKIQDYNGEMPFLVLVVDEVAEIQDDAIIAKIDRLVRLARAVGISVVCATQRPSTNVINGDLRAMFQARLCFQVADELNSRMVLGETCSLAAHLPAIKGRGIFKFGIVEKEVQSFYLPLSRATKMLPNSRGWDIENQPTKVRLLPR